MYILLSTFKTSFGYSKAKNRHLILVFFFDYRNIAIVVKKIYKHSGAFSIYEQPKYEEKITLTYAVTQTNLFQ